jgi:hypothetical protein
MQVRRVTGMPRHLCKLTATAYFSESTTSPGHEVHLICFEQSREILKIVLVPLKLLDEPLIRTRRNPQSTHAQERDATQDEQFLIHTGPTIRKDRRKHDVCASSRQ